MQTNEPGWSDAVGQTLDTYADATGNAPLAVTAVGTGTMPAASLWKFSATVASVREPLCEHVGINLRGDAILERIIDGRCIWRGAAAGTLIFLRGEGASNWRLVGANEAIQVYISKSLSQALVNSALPDLPSRDPVLFQMGKVLSVALKESGGDATYIAPLLQSFEQCVAERLPLTGYKPTAAVPFRLTERSRKSIRDFIDDNIHRKITADDLARLAGLSLSHFHRVFSATFGFSPRQYILDRRVTLAAHLLSVSGESIASIALRCGFSHPSHMGSEFRSRLGVTPSAYRRTH